jgi:hypothetical protein
MLPEQPEAHAEAQAALKAFFDRHHRMVTRFGRMGCLPEFMKR